MVLNNKNNFVSNKMSKTAEVTVTATVSKKKAPDKTESLTA